MNHIFYIRSSVMGHLGCFQLLATTNKATMNIMENMPLWHCGATFGYIPKSGITRSSGRSICNFLRHFQIDFQNGCTSLKSHWKGRSVPLSLHSHQHALSPKVLILTILIGVRWNLWVILICIISLIIKDFEHFFRYFSTIQDSLVINSQFSSIPRFFFFFHCFVWDF